MKVYISLPITGYNYTDRRGKAATVYMNLLGKGFEPVSPMDNGLGEHDSRAAHMKADFRLLFTHRSESPRVSVDKHGFCFYIRGAEIIRWAYLEDLLPDRKEVQL